ncbi:hypothetical protein MLD38_017842 [Melastoma candidum]|uniref:Uncharacterized protein n=1 Tax=Melastoma candidum TaxID=119954 RepID=A0ACB9QS01_9MYRT|nr:hypothetical protein MLD38_017842 [Melastoma candidum]
MSLPETQPQPPRVSASSAALGCRDIILAIFDHLSVPDLARARCVCREWNSVASDGDVIARAFRSTWKIKAVVGVASSDIFWRDNSIGKFAISHAVRKGDSVARLAVKYSVQVMDIRRLNNMMSDHGIFSRDRLLIPISNPNILIDSTCYIELDNHAKREAAVVYLEGGPNPDRISSLQGKTPSSEHGRRKILESLKRSMRVDDGTAQYYLSISNGDPRAALSEFSEDLRWERQARLT